MDLVNQISIIILWSQKSFIHINQKLMDFQYFCFTIKTAYENLCIKNQIFEHLY